MTRFTIESWTWYGFAVSMVILRLYDLGLRPICSLLMDILQYCPIVAFQSCSSASGRRLVNASGHGIYLIHPQLTTISNKYQVRLYGLDHLPQFRCDWRDQPHKSKRPTKAYPCRYSTANMGEQGNDNRRTVHVRRTMGHQDLLAYIILEINAGI